RHYSTGAPDAALLVFYHGGGQVIGSLDSHDDLCREICRAGAVHVLSVDYRLAPEHPAPAGAEDAYAAYRWAAEHARELGADPHRIAVGGDSAGANLAALVSLRARDEGQPLPALQLLVYPVVNYQAQTRSKTLFARDFFLTRRDLDWFSAHYLGDSECAADDPRVSPLLADDLSGLPPALLVTAGFDPLRDEGRQYADALRAAATPVDHREYGEVVHGFANFFTLGGASATATADVISAMRAHLTRVG
ncbi:MAG: alpha/beta hydrolase, partial [Actinomycetota bacterium]|nr:alpha/beta hydrolase [Actinomycetota bacterium]